MINNLVDSRTKGQQMKKLLMIAALASLSSPAFASKARVNALGNADHLVDAQTAFDNPSHLTLLPDYVTFEAGATNAPTTVANWGDVVANAAAPTAEGGFTQSSGDAKWGFYMGRKSPFTQYMRKNFGFLGQENPIELQYAMKGPMAWGVAFNYSSADQKSTSQKQSAMGLRLGATTDLWEAFAVIGLGSTADGTAATTAYLADYNGDGLTAGETFAVAADTGAKYKGTTGFKVGGAYKMDSIRVYGKYYMDGFQMDTTAGGNAALNGSKQEQSQLDVGVLDITKLDAGSWFYGVAYQMYTAKTSLTSGESKTTASYMPFIAGLEYDAASWMTLRGSVSQNVLLGSIKNDDGAGVNYNDETDTIKNNTKVAAGIGLKFNKWAIDGSWAAATTGTVNTTALMTNLGLTYSF